MRTATVRQVQEVHDSDRIRLTDASREPRVSAAERTVLQGWKEIAAELGRSVRTVQRWERTLNLPVHRLGRSRGRPAFAFKDELHVWLRNSAGDDVNRKPTNLSPVVSMVGSPRKEQTTLLTPLLVKQASVAKKAAVPSDPEIIRALNAFFAVEASRHKAASCGTCNSQAQLLVGHFWLYGTEKTWQVSVPFCPNCDSDVRALLPSSSGSRGVS